MPAFVLQLKIPNRSMQTSGKQILFSNVLPWDLSHSDKGRLNYFKIELLELHV